MQRHFSNRGEAVAEVAAAKMMAHHRPGAKSSQRGTRLTPAQWKIRVPDSIPVMPRKKGPKESDQSQASPLEF